MSQSSSPELILIRHAKTEAGLPGLSDFERALLPRGEADAQQVARDLLTKGLQPDLLVSSPARRAISTARLMAGVWNIMPQHVEEQAALYHATTDTWAEVVRHLPGAKKQVVIFGHNEGISEFARQLCPGKIADLPTAGVFALQLACAKWEDFRADDDHRFLFAHWPGNTL